MCILEPFGNFARGGIETDTNVEVLMIHQSVLQRYAYTSTDAFRDKIDTRSAGYPEDSRLLISLKQAEEWKGYKSDVMRGIKKTRWPVDKRRIRTVRGGTIITHDLETKFTKDSI